MRTDGCVQVSAPASTRKEARLLLPEPQSTRATVALGLSAVRATRWDGRGRAEGFSMCWIDSGMLVATTCTLGTFFSPMCAASQILPSGPFLASTYWE